MNKREPTIMLEVRVDCRHDGGSRDGCTDAEAKDELKGVDGCLDIVAIAQARKKPGAE